MATWGPANLVVPGPDDRRDPVSLKVTGTTTHQAMGGGGFLMNSPPSLLLILSISRAMGHRESVGRFRIYLNIESFQ